MNLHNATMRGMPDATHENCPICGSKVAHWCDSKDYISGETFSVHICSACGLGQTFPPVAPSELSKYYAQGYYKKRKSGADEYINRARLRSVVRNATGGKRILDVGCGNGALAQRFLNAGWHAKGVEMAPPEHFVSKDVQQHIFIGDIREAPFAPKSFDVITLFHVFEHLPEPRAYLSRIRELLTDKGLLIIEVPNVTSLQARLTRGKWFNLDVPRHVFHYTPQSLSKILEQSGFSTEQTAHYSPIYSFYGFVQSLLNLVTRRNNILFDVLNGKILPSTYRAQGIRLSDLVLTALFVAPASIISVPLTFLESLFKRGGIITAFSRPRS